MCSPHLGSGEHFSLPTPCSQFPIFSSSPAQHNHRLRAKSPSAVTQNCDPPPSTFHLSKLGLERSNLISVKVSWLYSSPFTQKRQSQRSRESSELSCLIQQYSSPSGCFNPQRRGKKKKKPNKNTAVSSITHTYTRCVCRAGPSQNPETMNLSSMAFLLQFQALPGGPPCHVLAIPIPASYLSFLLSQDIITSLRAAGLAKLYPGEGQDRDSKRRGGKRPGRVGWQKR